MSPPPPPASPPRPPLAPHAVTWVVPAFNESARLDPRAFAALLADPRVRVLAVDDGSRDDTRARLDAIAAAHPGRMHVIALATNAGKAEAVRRGMRAALDAGAAVVGYADADFATPPRELSRLADELAARPGANAVLGSRVRLHGSIIVRNELRHAAGRVYARVAQGALALPLYDTQCGAKLFRATPALAAALATPFSSRWSFDVELIARLVGRLPSAATLSPDTLVEVPLAQWHEVPGSTLKLPGMARAFADLLVIWGRARRHRTRPPRG